MTKGQETKSAILDEALALASRVGFTGLTIGQLAEQTGMSKSGLFAHFQSKEQLQLQTLAHARQKFIDTTVRPALAVPRGEKRVRELFERWLTWETEVLARRLHLRHRRRSSSTTSRARCATRWSPTSATGSTPSPRSSRPPSPRATSASDIDPRQFAFEIQGLTLGFHHSARLLDDEQALDRVRTAFEAILDRARAR